MEVGQVYENRHGQYRVREVFKKRGVVVFEYLQGGGVSTGSVDVMSRIHLNIQSEREAKEHAQQVYSQFAVWLDEIAEQGFRIMVHCHPNFFPEFQKRYRNLTKETVEPEDMGISLCKADWQCCSLRVVYPMRCSDPVGYHVRLHGDEKHISNTEMGWQLIKHGFRIGRNKRK